MQSARLLNTYARALAAALQGATERDAGELSASFLQLLKKNRLLAAAEEIVNRAEEMVLTEAGAGLVKTTTAYPLKSEVRSVIKKIFGEKIRLTETVDEQVLGGILLEHNATRYDATIATSIRSLKARLHS